MLKNLQLRTQLAIIHLRMILNAILLGFCVTEALVFEFINLSKASEEILNELEQLEND